MGGLPGACGACRKPLPAPPSPAAGPDGTRRAGAAGERESFKLLAASMRVLQKGRWEGHPPPTRALSRARGAAWLVRGDVTGRDAGRHGCGGEKPRPRLPRLPPLPRRPPPRSAAPPHGPPLSLSLSLSLSRARARAFTPGFLSGRAPAALSQQSRNTTATPPQHHRNTAATPLHHRCITTATPMPHAHATMPAQPCDAGASQSHSH